MRDDPTESEDLISAPRAQRRRSPGDSAQDASPSGGNGAPPAPAEPTMQDVPPEALLGQRNRPAELEVGPDRVPPQELTIRQHLELPPQAAPPAAWAPPPPPVPEPDPFAMSPPLAEGRANRDEPRIEVRRARPKIKISDPRCPYCHEAVQTGEREQLACNKCRAWHHQDCWTEANSRCSSCGSKATGLYVPTSGVTPALSTDEVPSRLRRWAQTLPSWVWALGAALIVVGVLASLLLSEILLDERFSLGVLLSTLFSAGSIWSAVVALWSSRPDPNNVEYLGLPAGTGERTEAARAEIARRFAQSRERFRTTGLSLETPEHMSLQGCLVVCMQRADSVHQLLSVLTPISSHRLSPPVVLVVGWASTEVLRMFETNTEQGSFAGFIVSATQAQLREVARASGAKVIRRNREPTCRDVGRADLTVMRGGIDFVGPRHVGRVPYRD